MRYTGTRHKALASVVVVIIALLVMASGSQAANKVTLSYAVPSQLQPGFEAAVNGFNKAYEKSNVSVDLKPVNANTFGPLLLTQLQAGNAPDLFHIQSGAGSSYGVWRLAGQGRLLALTGSWRKRVPKAAVELGKLKGRTYAYQAAYSPQGLLYNRSLFKSMKLKIPTTFSQLLGMCRKIASTGKIPIAFGGATLNAPIETAVMVAGNNVYSRTPNWSLLREQNKVKFATSPQWRTALQQFVDMKNAKCFPPNPAAVTAQQQYQMVASGQSVMMISSSVEVQVVKGINPKLALGLFALPAPKASDTRVVFATVQAVVVANADTPHKFQANQFINYLARPEVSQLINKLNTTISGDDLKKGVVPSYMKDMSKLLKAGKSQISFNYQFGNPSSGIFNPGLIGKIPGLFTGQETVSSILQNLDTVWDRR